MDPTMSDDMSLADLAPAFRTDDDVGVRFPPGLGLIPPRDVPRPRINRRAAPDVAA